MTNVFVTTIVFQPIANSMVQAMLYFTFSSWPLLYNCKACFRTLFLTCFQKKNCFKNFQKRYKFNED
jgi:hypothetical protein